MASLPSTIVVYPLYLLYLYSLSLSPTWLNLAHALHTDLLRFGFGVDRGDPETRTHALTQGQNAQGSECITLNLQEVACVVHERALFGAVSWDLPFKSHPP